MVQCVTNDEIFRSINGFEESGIGIESTWEQDGVFSVVIIGDNFLQLFVDVLGTADESNWAHTKAMAVESSLSSLNESRVIGKSEVIIGTEIKNLFAVWCDFRPLRGGDYSFGLICAGLFH